ncbi:uncharacterized protein LOC128246083 [Mya arenaria]|uniref:uncharacterized protein LOC128246083 n=1 Tax=Mya arenaria TaxID=6604 RepID=UPI0022E1F78B|nr:uncharacterized protein LOC128246083 [Mya arenaria]
MNFECMKIVCMAFSIVPAFCNGISSKDSQLVAKTIGTENEERPFIPRHASSTAGNIMSGHHVLKQLIIPEESSEEQFVSLILQTAIENEINNLENAQVEDNALPRDLHSRQGRPLVSEQLKEAYLARNSEEKPTHKRNYPTWLLAPPYVDVTISHPTDDNSTYTENVAVSPDMTVIDAMIQATLSYRGRSGSDIDIPFNVMLDWDDTDDCFVIKRALGKNSRRRAGWSLTVKNMFQKEIYTGRCIPYDEVILRPFSSVSITYQRNQTRMRQRASKDVIQI